MFCIGVILLLSSIAVSADILEYSGTVPVDFSLAQSVSRRTDQNIGVCICDLTVNSCDMNCCCDSDCSESQIASFQSCLASSLVSNVPEYCSRSPITVNRGAAEVRTGDAGTCLYFKNVNEDLGVYLNDPGTVPNDAVCAQIVDKAEYKFAMGSLAADNIAYTAQGEYRAASKMLARYSKVSDLLGVYSVPGDRGDGSCNDYEPALFLVDTRSRCARAYSDLSLACVARSELDAKIYLEGLKFPAYPTATANVLPQFRNFRCAGMPCCLVGGIMGACAVGDDFSALVADTAALTLPDPVLVAGVCNNVMTGLNVTVTYSIVNDRYVIQGVIFDLVYGSRSGVGAIQQDFSIQFRESDALGVAYRRSGNPGYIHGAAVMAGKLATSGDKKAIQWTPNDQYGLTILSTRPDNGACTSNLAADRDYRIPVRYGENIVSGCTLEYSLADLQSNCAAIRQEIFNYQLGATNSNLNRVGRYGNSSVLIDLDWVEILNADAPATVSSINTAAGSSGGVCSGLLTEFNLYFLTVAVGSAANPQNSIVGARFEYVAGQFAYRCASANCQNSSIKQPFAIRSSVSFVPVSNAGFSTSASIDNLNQLRIAPDVFYPFWFQKLNDAPRSIPAPSVEQLVLSMLVAVAFVL